MASFRLKKCQFYAKPMLIHLVNNKAQFKYKARSEKKSEHITKNSTEI